MRSMIRGGMMTNQLMPDPSAGYIPGRRHWPPVLQDGTSPTLENGNSLRLTSAEVGTLPNRPKPTRLSQKKGPDSRRCLEGCVKEHRSMHSAKRDRTAITGEAMLRVEFIHSH